MKEKILNQIIELIDELIDETDNENDCELHFKLYDIDKLFRINSFAKLF